jgi:hypothetical protein
MKQIAVSRPGLIPHPRIHTECLIYYETESSTPTKQRVEENELRKKEETFFVLFK